ncbi:antibiotic biosynthesis monooxygenase family protein [Eubacteriaceae bacterium ES2]|nr:antibiotic biosynthesis monooxygenase family protein [Eubacteriaceae bacterium ES2]
MTTKQIILIHVTYTAKAKKRNDFLNALSQLGIIEQSKQEPGNIKYDYFLPLDSDDQLFLVEMWEDDEALTFHSQTDHYKQLQSIKNEFLIDTSIKKFYGSPF